MTRTEIAELTGIARANVHKAHLAGRLQARRTAIGDWPVRTADALQFANSRSAARCEESLKSEVGPTRGSRGAGDHVNTSLARNVNHDST